MITGALVGYKKGEPVLIEAGDDIASQTAKFKTHNLELNKGQGEYDKVYQFKGAFKTATKRAVQTNKKEKSKKEESLV